MVHTQFALSPMGHHPPRTQRSVTHATISLQVVGNSFQKKVDPKPYPFEKRDSQTSQLSLVSDRTDGTPVYKEVKNLLHNLVNAD
jgi:hypothetical protein